MFGSHLTDSLPENQLLAALPPEAYQRLAPHLEPVSLELEKILHRPGEKITHVYFPEKAMISLVTVVSNKRIEVGVVGREGMSSTAAFMGDGRSPFESMVQVANGGVRIEAHILNEEFKRGEALQRLFLRYAQTLYIQISQTAACNQLHSLDERLARWLLMTQDRIQVDTLLLKQEFLSTMLGVERSRVTLAAIALQEAEVIKYSRGKIKILSRTSLEKAACECYGLVVNLTEPLLPK